MRVPRPLRRVAANAGRARPLKGISRLAEEAVRSWRGGQWTVREDGALAPGRA